MGSVGAPSSWFVLTWVLATCSGCAVARSTEGSSYYNKNSQFSLLIQATAAESPDTCSHWLAKQNLHPPQEWRYFAKVPKASKSLKWANCLTSDFLLSTFNRDSMIMVEAITMIQTRMDSINLQVPIVLKERTLTSWWFSGSHMLKLATIHHFIRL